MLMYRYIEKGFYEPNPQLTSTSLKTLITQTRAVIRNKYKTIQNLQALQQPQKCTLCTSVKRLVKIAGNIKHKKIKQKCIVATLAANN